MRFGKKQPEQSPPWSDDDEAIVPPHVKVIVCPPTPAPTARPAAPRDEPGWSADSGDFFSDGEGSCDA